MQLKDPIAVYTAPTNLEAHVVVAMLMNNGVAAYAVEDQSGASLWMLGPLSQFHLPQIWVDRSQAAEAERLILLYEEHQRERRMAGEDHGRIVARCEECGQSAEFPSSQRGTVQYCPNCHAYIDVGETEWDDEVDEPDEADPTGSQNEVD